SKVKKMYILEPTLNKLPDVFAQKPKKEIKVHLIGIGGVAMASLAGLLNDAGYMVSGSDTGLYPPMSTMLKQMNLDVFEGYGPESLPPNVDLVIIGNVVSSHFPVLKSIVQRAVPYLSLPQALNLLFMNKTQNLVVAGCHGKTTTTAMCAKLWQTASLAPGFLIGGLALDFPHPWQLPHQNWFIIEGDEYDSAFFNKEPKFIHYAPHTVILTSIEFDHGDIYKNLDEIVAAYGKLIKLIPENGRLIACGDSPLVREVAKKAPVTPEFYGFGENNDWHIVSSQENSLSCQFELIGPNSFYARLPLNRPGLYNILNATAASAAFVGAGYDGRLLGLALGDFKGVKRRQEHLGTFGGVDLIDDFAHHPTAVKNTIAAMKKSFPNRPLWVAFEPRSNTSRRAIFQNDYAEALSGADKVFLRTVSLPEKAPENDRLDIEVLAQSLGNKAMVFEDGQKIAAAMHDSAPPNGVILTMSNGAFDHITDHLLALFSLN
ncbi:MAG: UDP-N-acetylmuramate--L-alanine ligase, partial [Candidatus Adiutrix sp.]